MIYAWSPKRGAHEFAPAGGKNVASRSKVHRRSATHPRSSSLPPDLRLPLSTRSGGPQARTPPQVPNPRTDVWIPGVRCPHASDGRGAGARRSCGDIFSVPFAVWPLQVYGITLPTVSRNGNGLIICILLPCTVHCAVGILYSCTKFDVTTNETMTQF